MYGIVVMHDFPGKVPILWNC